MLRIKKIFILSLLVIGLALPVQAKDVGTTSANFLKIGVGARATALGEAYTALVNDASALYWNPAALAQIKNSEFFAAYNSYLLDIAQSYIAFCFPSPRGSFGIGVNHIDMGKMEGYDVDEQGNPVAIGDFEATSSHISLGYGRKLPGGWLAGLSLSYLSDKIRDDTKSSFVGTIGILKQLGKNCRIGWVVQNIGNKLGKDPLPLTFKAGLAGRISSFTLSEEICFPRDNDIYICMGGEWDLTRSFSLRIGYKGGENENPGFSAGAGFKTGKFAFDYAFIPFGDLGNTHRVSLKVRF
ncbi:PorV/PorQ family protein [Candidatus Aerophobetes bacterium]|nr:PorV/PorQ family protein [Candidatus Aerophobetes bacterium]